MDKWEKGCQWKGQIGEESMERENGWVNHRHSFSQPQQTVRSIVGLRWSLEVHDSRSRSSLELVTLHSMAVDFAKTAALAEMAQSLKPREFPDFMQKVDKPMYASLGVHDSRSRSSLELVTLHSMAVDFAKTAALAKMAQSLKPREFLDFMQKVDKPMYASLGVL
ncbi:RNA-dependent RNA polymerase [Theobroma cacao]|nr:RNA-dependent RNA polymerase [Theobroma cacao]